MITKNALLLLSFGLFVAAQSAGACPALNGTYTCTTVNQPEGVALHWKTESNTYTITEPGSPAYSVKADGVATRPSPGTSISATCEANNVLNIEVVRPGELISLNQKFTVDREGNYKNEITLLGLDGIKQPLASYVATCVK